MIVHQVDNDRERALAFLLRNEAAFVPPLASRVDIEAYAAKLADRAENVYLVDTSGDVPRDVGHAAVYVSGGEQSTAFLSSFALDARWHGTGWAKRLLEVVEDVALDRGCRVMRLEVHPENQRAVAFYARYGFVGEATSGTHTPMRLAKDLSARGSPSE